MTVVPAIIPVTTPEVFTVAILVAVLLQLPPVAGSVKFILAPAQTVCGPVITPATGSGFTVTTAVAATVPQVMATK